VPLVTGQRHVDRHAFPAQAAGDRLRERFLVLDYQNSHVFTVPQLTAQMAEKKLKPASAWR